MSSAPIVDRIRIIPRPDDFLNRNVGSSGEVFFNGATSSLRVYTGKDRSGFELARADLTNIEDNALTNKLTDLGYSVSQGGGNTSITVSNSAPIDADEGQLWFDTDTGVLFVYYGEWIQPASSGSSGSVGSGSYTDADAISAITSNDLDMKGNKVLFGNVYPELGDLPSASAYHGMFAHVHSTGKGYFAHAGAWVELANAADAGGAQNLFSTISSNDGSTTANTNTDTLNVLGGTNINTTITTDTNNLTINMSPFSINFLSDVDTSSSAPETGNVLKWNGSRWAPGTDATVGGSGTDADTLDGFDSSYFLNYNNLTNTPNVVALDSFTIGNELTASGNGAISYDNATGVFRYTPPDLSAYLTTVAFSDLTSTPTTLAGYGITDAPSSLTDLGIVDGSNGQVLTTDGAGNFTFTTISGVGGEYSDTDVNAHLNTSTANTNEILSWTGSDYDWVAQSGEANQNAFSTIAVNGQTDVTADAATDTLTLVAGADISLTTNGNTVTISSLGGIPDFSILGEVATASVTVDKIYEPAITMFRVDNDGASAYTFSPHYPGNNPTIIVISGTTVAFDLDAIPGHPFELQDSTLTALTDGLVHVSPNGTVSTGSNAQGKDSGTLYWRIAESLNGTYAYQCQVHSSMVGAITIKRLSLL